MWDPNSQSSHLSGKYLIYRPITSSTPEAVESSLLPNCHSQMLASFTNVRIVNYYLLQFELQCDFCLLMVLGLPYASYFFKNTFRRIRRKGSSIRFQKLDPEQCYRTGLQRSYGKDRKVFIQFLDLTLYRVGTQTSSNDPSILNLQCTQHTVLFPS